MIRTLPPFHTRPGRVAALLAVLLALSALPFPFVRPVRADAGQAPPAAGASSGTVAPIKFEEEALENGLRVIYAPLHQAPVVQVRVLYHVGSRDERPDHQGFAHMFEHMMFRGSAHVKPEEHMKRVDDVGGICNAFTSFDQTVYHDTVPSSALEMAL